MSPRLCLLALGAAAALAACGGEKWPPTPEGHYMNACARCHEPDGSSATASKQAKERIDLRDPVFQAQVSDDEIRRIIRFGQGRMMAVTSLDSAAIDSVILHVRRLAVPVGSALDTNDASE